MQIRARYKSIIDKARATIPAHSYAKAQVLEFGFKYLLLNCNQGNISYVIAASREDRFLVALTAAKILKRHNINTKKKAA
jgi:hypothetical protein